MSKFNGFSEFMKSNVANISPEEIVKIVKNYTFFTQEDVFSFIVDNYGFTHYGHINPTIHKMEKKGQIKKTGVKRDSMFGHSMNVYMVVK